MRMFAARFDTVNGNLCRMYEKRQKYIVIVNNSAFNLLKLSGYFIYHQV
jgi:hypothetical protein